jgi:hypothetical protein
MQISQDTINKINSLQPLTYKIAKKNHMPHYFDNVNIMSIVYNIENNNEWWRNYPFKNWWWEYAFTQRQTNDKPKERYINICFFNMCEKPIYIDNTHYKNCNDCNYCYNKNFNPWLSANKIPFCSRCKTDFDNFKLECLKNNEQIIPVCITCSYYCTWFEWFDFKRHEFAYNNNKLFYYTTKQKLESLHKSLNNISRQNSQQSLNTISRQNSQQSLNTISRQNSQQSLNTISRQNSQQSLNTISRQNSQQSFNNLDNKFNNLITKNKSFNNLEAKTINKQNSYNNLEGKPLSKIKSFNNFSK